MIISVSAHYNIDKKERVKLRLTNSKAVFERKESVTFTPTTPVSKLRR